MSAATASPPRLAPADEEALRLVREVLAAHRKGFSVEDIAEFLAPRHPTTAPRAVVSTLISGLDEMRRMAALTGTSHEGVWPEMRRPATVDCQGDGACSGGDDAA